MEPIISTPEVIMVNADEYKKVFDSLKEMTDKFNAQYKQFINFRADVLAAVMESDIDFSYKRIILEDLGIDIPNRKYSFTVYLEVNAGVDADDVEFDVSNAISSVTNVEEVSIDCWSEN